MSQAASTTKRSDEYARALLSLLADLPADAPDRARVRDRLIESYLPLARHLARRFRNRGEPLDDLVQVAYLALVKSIDGFDVARGTAFTSYAVPMIAGELKRYFRDKGWHVRIPRRLQELRLEIGDCVDELCQRLGRSPTVADLAAHLGTTEEEIIEGLDCALAYRALSLSVPFGDATAPLGDVLGGADPDLDLVEHRAALKPLLARLPARDRRIIALRFFGNLTQSQIAAELGLSQMQVSRLLSAALAKLRAGLLTE
jgi:RNA polymerase sigma-B factor